MKKGSKRFRGEKKREREKNSVVFNHNKRCTHTSPRTEYPVDKGDILMFRLLHGIQLINVHFVQPCFCNPLSTNSLFRVFWARTTYLLGLGPKNCPYNINYKIFEGLKDL